MQLVKLDTGRISDWATFHDVFAEAFGFPAFYGRNMDAWIDCMSHLDEPASGMTKIHTANGGVVVLQLEDSDDFARRCPAQFEAIVDCAAFVNWRKVQASEPVVLTLSFDNHTRPGAQVDA